MAVAWDAAAAQRPVQAATSSWVVTGDVGGSFGGRWLDGAQAPTVVGTTGAVLSLGVLRAWSRESQGGLAVRVASQPIRVSEGTEHWDGGTLTDVRLLGVVVSALDRSLHRRAELELAAGVSILAGTQQVYPLSDVGTLLPTVEGGLVVYRSRKADQPRQLPLGLFVRVGLTRIDPTPSPSADVDAVGVTAGWVTRLSAGLRVSR